jgi:beta-glucosidase
MSGSWKRQDPNGATVRFVVTNTGKREGAEVAQLYLSYPESAGENEPPRQLKGFAKINLKPGESRTVDLQLDRRALSCWTEVQHQWQLAHGEFKVAVGNASDATPLQGSFVK